MARSTLRLAFVVSHPIQYYAPLYQHLAQRGDLALKVFFTWHGGERAVDDRGFGTPVAWDIPLTTGYEFETVPNLARDPGTHHFLGLRNPSLVDRLARWNPDAVHVTGWAWHSHLVALRKLRRIRIPTLFRGDSHLLDRQPGGLRWQAKRALLQRVYAWPSGFLVVGAANRAYYRAFGVESAKLFDCPHSIDVARFAEPAGELEREAADWRRSLGLDGKKVVLFAGKLERRKRPVDLMRAVQALRDPNVVLLVVGSGELSGDVNAIAAEDPQRFRLLPFQNQSRMPVVYRLADVFALPSAYGETWGLAVNEALACGRPVVVSDRVGCAADVVDASCGRIFAWNDMTALAGALRELLDKPGTSSDMRRAAAERAWQFDIGRTGSALMDSLYRIVSP